MKAPLLRLQFTACFFNNLPSLQKAALWFAASAVRLRAPVSDDLQGVQELETFQRWQAVVWGIHCYKCKSNVRWQKLL